MAEGVEGVGHLKNVSRAGVFVRTADLPRPGAPVALQFESPPTGGMVNLRGEVRWSTDGLGAQTLHSGFGVLLHEPPREFSAFLSWALEQAEKEEGQS